MNLLDVVVAALVVSAAAGGFRLGLLARGLSWAGMVVGLVVGARLMPAVLERVDPGEPLSRLVVAAGVLFGSAFLGQALGLLVGSRAHLALPRATRPLDRAGGAVAGAVGVLATVWLLAPTMADVPGAPARLARGSAIARAVSEATPAPPDPLQALRRLVGDNGFPQVFSELRRSPDVGPPPAGTGLPAEVAAAAAASSVQVRGRACDRVLQGSGFVADAGVVVTNAHVVAGVDQPQVVQPDGSRSDATVVHFDADRDLAVLAAPGVRTPALPRGGAVLGGTGAVFGYAGGGPLEVSPFAVRDEVDAVGRDIYGSDRTRRRVLVLAADLAPGDSGAALVDAGGRVVGVAFAIAPDRAGTAYALAVSELEAALAAPRAPSTGTGRCLA